jgi:NAD(P) transhydrogenase subunit alpha
MLIGIPREKTPGENRVAATPDTITKFKKAGFTVQIESGAGVQSHFTDADYEKSGAQVLSSSVWQTSKIILKVQPPTLEEAENLSDGAILISFIWPARNSDLLKVLARKQVTTFAIDQVPRISRAQKLDALSSMANIAGYRAVIEAAGFFGRFFTGQMTAAGKVPPAKVMVIGAGVAGLAAIGTARGLGAIVRAFDTRPEVKDQVKSMGAEFLELNFAEDGVGEGGYAKVMSEAFIKAEMALFAKQALEVDIIITTALIPGKRAPLLITKDMVQSMREGSVIVDMAAENGGNCELTVPDEVVVRYGVTIIGYADLPSRLPTQASQLYGNNLVHFVDDLCKSKKPEKPLCETTGLRLNLEDEIVRGAMVTHAGEITWPAPVVAKAAAVSKPKVEAKVATPRSLTKEAPKARKNTVALVIIAVLLILLGRVAPPDFLSHFTVFVLAIFIGWQVVWNVTPALHTPLMSVTNAISGIIVIGAIVQILLPQARDNMLPVALAGVAILVAMINVAGGFLVTHRMLGMFRRK